MKNYAILRSVGKDQYVVENGINKADLIKDAEKLASIHPGTFFVMEVIKAFEHEGDADD
ncbi:hypothetical protein WS105_0630 [Weissella ceti]|uniref:hypothetical protein n=1 Tax=Weissella ceti TaxID=759620 RepID=UPI0004F84344|nr:hypothetical protein [Weissella ceti]AIM64220.1 hypothetical protein WS105_0630 [Weissella ceti]